MSLLHAYFHTKNQQAFKRLLDTPHGSSTGQASSSGGKSWNRPNHLSSDLNVNARDALGRTVLHLAAASTLPSAQEYVRMLLAHSQININLQDYESHWTALHHSLYHGNIATALLLLQRNNIELDLKDLEGYRAFDLYNSTVEHTKPEEGHGMLYTWGANRNASLGLGDPDDRQFPDHVVLDRPATSTDDSLDTRFRPVYIERVVMAKLHTGVVSDEVRNNLRLCGFGSGGRLGPGNHTQYALQTIPLPASSATPFQHKSGPTPGNPQRIVQIALGQDHTLALTASGEVLSWGLNRFSQLGYAVEGSSNSLGGMKEEIQSAPRKVPGLRNKFILGVAACKTASACWVDSEVWTWGTNGGQLGYDRNAHPVQVSPRIVTKITQRVLSISLTETAMACLLESHDVVCLCNDIYFKINFPTQSFPSEITTYRPPQAVRNASIQKVTSCENTFAALSTNGELFTFTLPTAGAVKPQRVWALRKQFCAVTDVALGSDGSIIICTESGHVFVRSRTFKATSVGTSSTVSNANKTFKFQRVPYVHRVRAVCANSTGAFGAIKLETGAQDVNVEGPLIQESMAGVRPYLTWKTTIFEEKPPLETKENELQDFAVVEEVDDEEDKAILEDVKQVDRLCQFLAQDRRSRQQSTDLFDWNNLPFGADFVVQTQSGTEIPVHGLVCASRSSVLSSILAGKDIVQRKEWNITIKLAPSSRHANSPLSEEGLRLPPWQHKSRLTISGVHPISVLILLDYLYTDEVLAVWDPRISRLVSDRLAPFKVKAAQIKSELLRLAEMLDLPLLSKALDAPVKRSPQPSMADNLLRLSADVQNNLKNIALDHPSWPDVCLVFADHEVACHSAILRARSEFFASLFDGDHWTKRRWNDEGIIKIDLSHMRWKAASYIVKFLYGGDIRMFDVLDFVSTVNEVVEFMFEVLAYASELLLDRLFLLCASVIVKRVNIVNACPILIEASYYHVTPLVSSIHQYIAINLETFLESHLLDDLPIDVLRQLSVFIRDQQAAKSPVSRSGMLTTQAMEKYKEWAASEDFPQPITKTSVHPSRIASSAKLSPPGPLKKNRSIGLSVSPCTSPALRPQISPLVPPPASAGLDEDEVFLMDETVPTLALNQNTPTSSKVDLIEGTGSRSNVSWKVSAIPKVDMKSIMAEAATGRLASSRPASSSNLRQNAIVGPADTSNWRTPQQTTRQLPEMPERSSPGRNVTSSSPWRIPSIGNLKASPLNTPPTPSYVQPPRPTNEPALLSQSKPVTPVKPTGLPREPPQQSRAPGLGPMFSPSKQSPSKSGSSSGTRRVSSGSVWTVPPVQPTVQPIPSSSNMSFAAIQLAQLEQETVPVKDKRSLKEIQEEEQARQVEEDFLKWWAAEEERVKLEEQAVPAALQTPSRQQNKSKKGKSKGPSGQGTVSAKPQPQPQSSRQRQEASGDATRKRNRKPPAKNDSKRPPAQTAQTSQ